MTLHSDVFNNTDDLIYGVWEDDFYMNIIDMGLNDVLTEQEIYGIVGLAKAKFRLDTENKNKQIQKFINEALSAENGE